MSEEFDRPEIRPGDNGLDHGWQAVSEDDLAAEESAGVGGLTSWSGSTNGADVDRSATLGDEAGTANGGVSSGPTRGRDRSDLNAADVLEPHATGGRAGSTGATDGGRGNEGAGGRDEWVETFERLNLDDLDPDGGTPIAGPEDRTDVGNLRGGQRDAATGGSDLGATTGGGDTGAV